MFTLKIKNDLKQELTLTQSEKKFQVTKIAGLNPPQAQINRSTIAGMDGSKFNSSKLEERNIVIEIKINGNVEENRLILYSFFKTKTNVTLFYQNSNRNVFINGYVESFECDLFSKSEVAQVSIICPQSYFKSLQYIIDDVSKIMKCFSYPFSINIGNPIPFSEIELEKIKNVINDSETECGLIIEMTFSGTVSKIELRNTNTFEKFIINYNFIENDKLTINTNNGEKSVTLLRQGETINLLPYMEKGSSFFKLQQGDNFFSYLADDGENDNRIMIYFKHYSLYRGV